MQGALVVFSIADWSSWDEVGAYCSELQGANPAIPIILVGAQGDRGRERPRNPPRSAILKYAAARGMPYIETSAKTGANVTAAFHALLFQIIFRARAAKNIGVVDNASNAGGAGNAANAHAGLIVS